MSIESLPIDISDVDFYLGISEIRENLELVHKDFSTHAISGYAPYLQGQKDTLKKIIRYLKKVEGVE